MCATRMSDCRNIQSMIEVECGTYVGEEKCTENLVGEPEGERPLVKTRRRWQDNINNDLTQIGFVDLDWDNLVQDWDMWRVLVKTIMNLRVPFMTICVTNSFWRRDVAQRVGPLLGYLFNWLVTQVANLKMKSLNVKNESVVLSTVSMEKVGECLRQEIN